VRSFAGAAERQFLTLDSLAVLDRARREPEVLVKTVAAPLGAVL
jgi:hypothetical protein